MSTGFVKLLLAPRAGLEPTTTRSTAERSTSVLRFYTVNHMTDCYVQITFGVYVSFSWLPSDW